MSISPLLGMSTKESEARIQIVFWKLVFIAAFFTVAKGGSNLRVHHQINE
jgi:hypothetical protein